MLVRLPRQEEYETDMTVDPIVCQLVCHNPPRCVVDQDVNPIRTACDFICCLLYFLPVRKIALQPCNLLGYLLAHFFVDGIDRAVDHFFGYREDEEFLDAMGKERVAGAIPNTFRATSDDGDFAFEIGRIVKIESLAFWHQLMSPLCRVRCQACFHEVSVH